jgi:limonene-1,2-epoxide hydrolase
VVAGDEKTVIDHNLTVARRICEAWNLMDLDEYHRLFDAQVDYLNVPFPDNHQIGPDAVHAVLSAFLETWDATLRVDNIAASGNVVLTERTENFTHRAGDKPPFELPVMGVFEFRDGKITAWRDYFELSQLRVR